jgi:mRNA-degrading endonuclease YafQ of YafQ-DinJ toxin-antitoxin module
MHDLVFTRRFFRAYASCTKRSNARRKCVDGALTRLQINPRDPRLKTHRLKGTHEGQMACSCGYDCRIIFTIDSAPQSNAPKVILLDVGSHDEVY